MPLYCYPGYQAIYNDTESLSIERGENDILRIRLPAGATSGTIRVKYVGFWYFHAGNAITAATIIAVIAVPVIRRRKSRRPPKQKQCAENCIPDA